jgi:hypothetical protein
MKPTLITLLLLLILSSCKTVEERIKDYSYTDEWFLQKVDTLIDKESKYNLILKDKELYVKYQVYQTKIGRKYIIVLNKDKNNLKRKYI